LTGRRSRLKQNAGARSRIINSEKSTVRHASYTRPLPLTRRNPTVRKLKRRVLRTARRYSSRVVICTVGPPFRNVRKTNRWPANGRGIRIAATSSCTRDTIITSSISYGRPPTTTTRFYIYIYCMYVYDTISITHTRFEIEKKYLRPYNYNNTSGVFRSTYIYIYIYIYTYDNGSLRVQPAHEQHALLTSTTK